MTSDNNLVGLFSTNTDAVVRAHDLLVDHARLPIVTKSWLPIWRDAPIAVNGLFCETIFGPVDARDPQAWGQIQLPVPVFHPSLATTIAEDLGLTTDQVVAIGHWQAWIDGPNVVFHEYAGDHPTSGPQGLHDALATRDPRLADRRLLRCIPVPPVTQRTLEPRMGGLVLPDPLSEGLARVLYCSKRVARLIELHAPEVIWRHEWSLLQQAFEATVSRVSSPVEIRPAALACTPPTQTLDYATFRDERDPATVNTMAFAGDDRLVIDYASATLVIGITDGGVHQIIPSANARLDYCTATTAVFSWHDSGTHCFDLHTHAWLPAPPPELRYIVAANQLIESPEAVVHGPILDGLRTACGRFVVNVDVAEEVNDDEIEPASWLVNIIRYDGQAQLTDCAHHEIDDPDDEDGDDDHDEDDDDDDRDDDSGLPFRVPHHAIAVALWDAGDAWRWVSGRRLYENGTCMHTFDRPVNRVAFNARGDELIVLSGDSLVRYRIRQRDVIPRGRHDLTPLRSLFSGSDDVEVGALHAVLSRYGTLLAVRECTPQDLAALTLVDGKVVGLETAERILKASRRIAPVTQVPIHRVAPTD